jgi:hypothetical protein
LRRFAPNRMRKFKIQTCLFGFHKGLIADIWALKVSKADILCRWA